MKISFSTSRIVLYARSIHSSPIPFPIENHNRLKVALIGDANSYTQQLAEALGATAQVDCFFYGPKKPLRGPTKGSVRFRGFKTYKPTWTERLYPFQIIRQSLRDRPDVLHIDFTITEFSSEYLNMVSFPLLVAVLRLLRLKVVLTIHDVLSRHVLEELYGEGSLKAKFAHFGLLFYLRFLGLSDAIIVHLNFLRDTLIREFFIDPRKIVVVPFGVSIIRPEGHSFAQNGRFNGKKVVLAFGVVAPRKGLEYVIHGFSLIASKHPDAILVLAGPRDTRRPEYLDSILAIARSAIDSRQFSYAGYLDETSANSLIFESRVAVLSYLYACATTSILYWVMSYGMPVVASAIETLLEELKGYDRSLFVGPKDPAEIARALDLVLTDDVVAANATKYMKTKASFHSWGLVAQGIINAYWQTPLVHRSAKASLGNGGSARNGRPVKLLGQK